MKSMTFCISVVLLAAALLSAAATSPESALQVTSTGFQPDPSKPGSVQVSIVVRNASSRTITGFSYSLLAHYGDGSQRTAGQTIDLLPYVLMRGELASVVDPPRGDPLPNLGPDRTHRISAFLPLTDSGLLPVSVAATITMVAFDDNTTLGDSRMIARLQGDRTRYVEVLSAVLADLRSVRMSDNPKERLSVLIAADGAVAAGPFGPLRLATLKVASQKMESSGIGALDSAVTLYEALVTSAMKYTNLSTEVK